MTNSEIDPKWTMWLRNVTDDLKGLSKEDIKKIVKERSLPFAIMMSNLQGDFNFGTIIRSANALGANQVFYYGKKKFDRRSALGTYHYIDVNYLSSYEEVVLLKEKFSFVALENNITRNIISLPKFNWQTPKIPLIIVGEESIGISEDVLNISDYFVEIPSRGSVRSINAGSAASIAMYDFVSKLENK